MTSLLSCFILMSLATILDTEEWNTVDTYMLSQHTGSLMQEGYKFESSVNSIPSTENTE